MRENTSCPICLETFVEASLLPACGHSFCLECIRALPARRRHLAAPLEALCPLCREPFTPGTAVANWSLREAAAARLESDPLAPAQLHAGPTADRPRLFLPGEKPDPGALSALGIPSGLARLAHDEAARVGVRIFLLDNSGSTNTMDGHVLSGGRLRTCTRWEEIREMARSACALGAATGVPCEFHLLNPLRGRHAFFGRGDEAVAVEGVDWVRTAGGRSDARALDSFLDKVVPQGVTPLAERLRTLRPRFDAFAAETAGRGALAFLVIATDGAPTPRDSGSPTPAAAAAALGELRALTAALPVRLVVRLCTDEDEAVSFWNGADAETELPLDVLDDLTSEAREVRSAGNGWFAYTPALHMLRESGTLVGLLDLLDERALRPGEAATLASLLLDVDLPDWKHEAAEFAPALRAAAVAAGGAFDPRRSREVPVVDAEAALRAVEGRRSLPARLVLTVALVAIGLAAAVAAATRADPDAAGEWP